jgi:SAM-dependent methyltransferase
MQCTQWLGLLECPVCAGALDAPDGSEFRCTGCGFAAREDDGVFDFLVDPHPTVSRERDAIRTLDRKSADQEFSACRRWLRLVEDGGQGLEGEERASPFLTNLVHHRREIAALLRGYPLRPGGALVELGADHCWASGLFLDCGLRVIAVDISDHLRLARRGGSGGLLRIQADMNRLPIGPGTVDYVFANAAAHHSWDLTTTFREAHRVLRPGGRFYLCSEPMPSVLRYVSYAVLGGFGREERALGINETLRTRRAWAAIARRAGFEPQFVFPALSPGEVREKLRSRHIPPALGVLARPVMKQLQVSIHMVADKA